MSEDKNKYDKFIWKDGDTQILSEEEFKKLIDNVDFTLYEFKKEFSCCNESICCSCDEEDVELANRISFKIFQFVKKEYFQSIFKNQSFKPTILKIFNNLISLCQKLLPEEVVLTKQLYCAVYMSLLDKIEKDTDIELTKEDIETLVKSFK